MAIKVKQSGAYADVVGVFAKAGGTYSAVQGIYAKSAGAYESISAGRAYPAQFFVNLSNPVNGVITDSQAVVTINYVGNLNPVITAHRTSGVAPLSVNFNASLSQINPALSSLPFHEVRYTWDFGDDAATYWAYGNKPGAINKNFHAGPVAAHLFETPGTRTVTVTAEWRDPNTGALTTASKTITITVDDPDVVFAGANTICVSNTGTPGAGDPGVPAGATRVNQTDWATAIGLASGGTKRLLLKRGETWTTTADGVIPAGTIGHIGSYGTGANPKIIHNANVRGISVLSGRHDWRITDLEFESSESGTTDAENQYKIPIDAISANNLTVARVKTRTSFTAMQAQLSSYPAMYACDMQDTFVNYGNMLAFFYKCHGVSILGSRLDRSYETHTLRASGTTSCVIAYNDIKNPGPTRDAITVRGWEAPTPITQYVQISDNLIDGGTVGGYILYCGIVNINTNEELRDVIVERNTILSDSPASPCVFGVAQGLTFRSNLVKSVFISAVEIGGGANVAGAPNPTSSWFYDNTFYKPNVTTTDDWSTFKLGDIVTGVVIRNNLAYAPGNTSDAGQNGSAGTMIYTTGSVTSSDYTESNNTTNTQLNTVRPWAATSPTALLDYAPNGYGLNAGTYVPVFDDILGEEITTGVRDMGAVQA